MSEHVKELSKNGFDEFTKEGLVLVDFFADWCMPCLMMAPVLDEVAEKFNGKIKVGKINVDDHSELAVKFKVSSIPNLVLLKDKEEIDRFVGAVSQEELEEKLEKHLK